MSDEFQVGQPAPDFMLPSGDGETSPSSKRGQKVILAFYPFDFSPG
ncbi:MAG: redoxin domain-containing protein [Chloroflexi bacterium]|nr:redoxin domain-containing protein [Chloroflexota bacterium]